MVFFETSSVNHFLHDRFGINPPSMMGQGGLVAAYQRQYGSSSPGIRFCPRYQAGNHWQENKRGTADRSTQVTFLTENQSVVNMTWTCCIKRLVYSKPRRTVLFLTSCFQMLSTQIAFSKSNLDNAHSLLESEYCKLVICSKVFCSCWEASAAFSLPDQETG